VLKGGGQVIVLKTPHAIAEGVSIQVGGGIPHFHKWGVPPVVVGEFLKIGLV